ncbi:MAG: ABC transporter substrate-binding protein [Alphaproteobacteria bacterium]
MKNLLATLTITTILAAVATAEDMKLNLLTSVNPGEPSYEVLLEQVEIFEAKHPGVDIEVQATGHDEYFTKLQALTIADQLPDLIHLWPGERTIYVLESGKVMDLMPFVKRDGLEDKILPMILKPQNDKGQVFVLGNNVNITNIVYANDAVLKEAGLEYPKTFEDWYSQVDVLRKNKYYPLVMGNASSWVAQSCLLSPIVGRIAGDEWVNKAIAKDASFADEPFVNSLKVIAEMNQKGLLPKAMNSLPRSKAVELFTAGKAAYFIEGAWSGSEFENIMTDEELDNMSLHFLPSLNGKSATTSAIAGTSYGINAKLADTPKAEIAWQWIKFFNGFGDQEGVNLAIKGGVIPPIKNLNVSDDAPKFVKKLAELQTTLDETSYVLDGVLRPKGVEYLNTALQELIAGEATPEDIAKKYESVARD